MTASDRIRIVDVDVLPVLKYDHAKIVGFAVEALRAEYRRHPTRRILSLSLSRCDSCATCTRGWPGSGCCPTRSGARCCPHSRPPVTCSAKDADDRRSCIGAVTTAEARRRFGGDRTQAARPRRSLNECPPISPSRARGRSSSPSPAPLPRARRGARPPARRLPGGGGFAPGGRAHPLRRARRAPERPPGAGRRGVARPRRAAARARIDAAIAPRAGRVPGRTGRSRGRRTRRRSPARGAEETGLDPAGVEVLGTLENVPLAYSQHLVTPVLAWWRHPSPVRVVDEAESSDVFRAPVADLLDPANRGSTVIRRDGQEWRGPGFLVPHASGDHLVWGFTGHAARRDSSTASAGPSRGTRPASCRSCCRADDLARRAPPIFRSATARRRFGS